MKCSEVERVLPEILDEAPGVARPAEIKAHLESCPACSDLVADLTLISREARQLAATEEPPPRLWVRIAAELQAEGLIRDSAIGEPEPMLPRTAVMPASARRRSAWWLTPVAAAVLAAGAYLISHKPNPQLANQQTSPIPLTSQTPVTQEIAQTPARKPDSSPRAAQLVAQNSAKPAASVRPTVETAPNEEDRQFLSVVSTLGPSMRVTYENQLQAVNADIRETQAYVDRNPADADARQHLMDAYQQKALLYQIALDRIQ